MEEKRGRGRPNDEEAAIIFEKEKAEARERNKTRHLRNNSARGSRENNGQFVSTKSNAEQLYKSVKQLLSRLVKESGRSYITNVNFSDEISVKRRRAQLSNVKDLLVIIKQLRDLITEVRGDEDEEKVPEKLKLAHVADLEKARETLKEIGLDEKL